LKSVDQFIEDRTSLSEEERFALWLLAPSGESGRENRLHRVAELIGRKRHLAGRVRADARVDRSGADESVGGRNQVGLGVGLSGAGAD
jgi:hypothetical protein